MKQKIDTVIDTSDYPFPFGKQVTFPCPLTVRWDKDVTALNTKAFNKFWETLQHCSGKHRGNES
jgi:hypothetical protein